MNLDKKVPLVTSGGTGIGPVHATRWWAGKEEQMKRRAPNLLVQKISSLTILSN